MFTHLKPYPEYRATGLRWLPRVPRGWDMRRLRFLLKEVDRRSATGNEQLLRVSQYTGVTERRVADGADPDTRARSLVGYKLVAPSDLVVNIMLAWNGSLGVSPCSGIVSPAYCVYRFRDSMQPDYYHHLLRSPLYKGRIRVESTGVVESRLRLYTDDLKRLEGLVPPEAEQAAIVRYLAHANRRIDQAIAAKRKLIRLLEEQKRVIISQVMTTGLDPRATTRDTGVGWLGPISERWETRRLRHLIEGKLTYGANEPAVSTDSSWPRYIRITDFGSDGRLRPETFRSLPPEKAADYAVAPGDLLFARSGATVGKCFRVADDTGPACHAGYLIRARPRETVILSTFLYVYTRSAAFERWKEHAFSRATIQNIGADKYANLVVPLPPLDEQRRIVSWLDDATIELGQATERSRREIELLREFRTRLTSDVVTGQVDVRSIAASLPEVSLDELAEPVDGSLDDELDELAEEFAEDAALV